MQEQQKSPWILSSGVLIRKRCSPQGDSTGDCSVLPGEGCGTSGQSIPVKSIYQLLARARHILLERGYAGCRNGYVGSPAGKKVKYSGYDFGKNDVPSQGGSRPENETGIFPGDTRFRSGGGLQQAHQDFLLEHEDRNEKEEDAEYFLDLLLLNPGCKMCPDKRAESCPGAIHCHKRPGDLSESGMGSCTSEGNDNDREHRDWRVMAGMTMGKSTKRNITRIHPQSNENLSNDPQRDRVPLS